MKKQLTISDVRQMLYDMAVRAVNNNVSDEELLAADFWYDLGMDEQHVLLLCVDLQRVYRIFLPPEVTQALNANNTVSTFLEAANALLQDLEEE
ncbi:MAG: hypothetical protein IJ770_04240 [Alphaproteobacteria bacterium]|nr:hypothetical protein [Alphaproteobacteria bacterium]